MGSILGKCPYCEDGNIDVRKVTVEGQKIKLFACTNAKWKNDYGDWFLTEDSTCGFKIFANKFLKYNKRSISENEIRELLDKGDVQVRLYNRLKKEEYFKTMVTDEEYGATIIWD